MKGYTPYHNPKWRDKWKDIHLITILSDETNPEPKNEKCKPTTKTGATRSDIQIGSSVQNVIIFFEKGHCEERVWKIQSQMSFRYQQFYHQF
jgi:hypothetical protein